MIVQDRPRRRPVAKLQWGQGWGVTAICVALALSATAHAQPEPTKHSGVLDLLDDGFLIGKLVPAAGEPGRPRTTLLWQSPLFDAPLEFAIDGIGRVRFPKGAAGVAGADVWRVDLRGGDCVEGDIEAIDADHIVLAANDVGGPPLRIRRGEVVRLTRKGSAVKTIVPGGLAGWDAGRGAWREQAGRLVCDKPGSGAFRDVTAPARACFTLNVSWDERPDMELLFAAGPEEMARLKAGGGKKAAVAEEYRIEVTAGDMLVVREGATAKFDLAATLPAGRGAVELQVFVDQARGRMAVVMPGGAAGEKPVFDETLAPRKPAVRSGFAIRLRGGDVRIDGLRVSAWKGDALRESGGGPVGPGTVEAFDKAQGMFTVRGPEGPRQVAATDFEVIDFPANDTEPAALPAGSVLAAFHGGSRLTGRILEVTADALRLECPALAEPLECKLERLAVLDTVGVRQPAALPGQPGMLDATGGRMVGCLANAAGATEGIAWQPRGAVGPVAIRPATEPLQIAYRGLAALGGVGIGLARKGDAWVVAEVAPGGPAARDGRIVSGWRLESIRMDEAGERIAASGLKPDEVRGLLRGVVGSQVRLQFIDPAGAEQQVDLVRDAGGRGDLAGGSERDVLEKALKIHEARLKRGAKTASGQATVYLKTGDSITCTVLSANAEGLRVRTDLVADLVVPAIALRAVELVPGGPGSISKDKLARLLTLPRMQQADPPTHMLRLPNGDYLRGKVLSLDERVLRMNVLGVDKEFPRAEVARLIWLSVEGDASESEALAAVTGGGKGRGGVVVRATMTDGRRLTLAAQRLDGGRLVGESGVLGTVGVDLAACDTLALGAAPADASPVELPYSKWKLKPAPVPRVLRDAAAATPVAGPSPPRQPPHPLVGKALALPGLRVLEPQANGRRWLGATDLEGRIGVVVLFDPAEGASLEPLPAFAEAFAPLAEDAVELVAIGTGGSEEIVAKAVASLPRRPAVTVDPSGIVARLLGKPALPTCLIIDREGRVAAVMPARAADLPAIRTRVTELVAASQQAATEFAALTQAREAAWSEDRRCLEPLGVLLGAESETVRTRTAALLRDLTGLSKEEMPFKPGGDAAQRAEQVRRWRQWLAAEGITAELSFPRRLAADAAAARPIFGYTLVCRPGNNDVVELDAEGAEVFRVAAAGPWALDVLPNGHRLVGEHGGKAVVEYDLQGKEVWAVRNLPGGPMSVRRLENGNTLVSLSDADLVAEYDQRGTKIWSVAVKGRPCDARRLPDGNTLVAAHRANRIVEVDAEGRELWTVEGIDDPQTAQRLPNGNTLVAMSTPGIVREIDRDGGVVWQIDGFRVAVDAQRLPDGTTLVQQQQGDLVELDADGEEIKRTRTGGSRILRW